MQPPESDAEKIREAVRWFDLVDKLLARIEIESVENPGDVRRMYDVAGPHDEIQRDLLRIADRLEGLDA